ncbi:MAG: type I methionyl aminopeptidase [Candidatus Paceibacterota bacterium]|jgi:methionyl aminopeptidase
MIRLKTKADIEVLKESGKRLSNILFQIAKAVKPGVKTRELDDLALSLIRKNGDKPAFLDYRSEGSPLAYPAALCVSINEEIVHGVPGERVLQAGDIVGLDLGLNHKGFFTDMAMTVPVGEISDEDKKLIKVAKQALEVGIKAAKSNGHIGDISAAIQKYVEGEDLNVVRELAGHGVGYAVHEDPFVPNYGRPHTGEKLKPGLVLAIEPMVTAGSGRIVLEEDGFTFSTRKGENSAHFEKTIAITEKGVIILTN